MSHYRWRGAGDSGDGLRNGGSHRNVRPRQDGCQDRWRTRERDKPRPDHACRPASSNDAGAGRSVTVTVSNFAGAVLFGPEPLRCTTLVAELKERLRKGRRGTGVRLLLGTKELFDHDHLELSSGPGEPAVNLTAVLSKTYGVVTWGESTYGGKGPQEVADGILALYGSSGAFAAITEGGGVFAWGHGAYGGDTGAAAKRLTSDVVSIVAGQNAFVALKKDGSAVPWGNAKLGGRVHGDAARRLCSGVQSVTSSGEAFAALKDTGEVVAWGQDVSGGDASDVAHQLQTGISKVYASRGAFAAVSESGAVVTWGGRHSGGNSASVRDQLASGIVFVCSNVTSFAALNKSGAVITWGNESCGGRIPGALLQSLSRDVISITSSGSAFAAVRSDGTVISWGMPGEPCLAAEIMAKGGIALARNSRLSGMVLEGGKVIIEGVGGEMKDSVAMQLESGVSALVSTSAAFAAVKEGSVLCWGHSSSGGDAKSVASALQSGIISICSTQSAFAALKDFSN